MQPSLLALGTPRRQALCSYIDSSPLLGPQEGTSYMAIMPCAHYAEGNVYMGTFVSPSRLGPLARQGLFSHRHMSPNADPKKAGLM